MCNQEILDKLKDKQTTITVHYKSMKESFHQLKHIKVQLIICTEYKLVAHIMISDHTNITNIKMNIK